MVWERFKHWFASQEVKWDVLDEPISQRSLCQVFDMLHDKDNPMDVIKRSGGCFFKLNAGVEKKLWMEWNDHPSNTVWSWRQARHFFQKNGSLYRWENRNGEFVMSPLHGEFKLRKLVKELKSQNIQAGKADAPALREDWLHSADLFKAEKRARWEKEAAQRTAEKLAKAWEQRLPEASSVLPKESAHESDAAHTHNQDSARPSVSPTATVKKNRF